MLKRHATAVEPATPRQRLGQMPPASVFRARLGLALLVSVVLVGSVVSAPIDTVVVKESTR